MNLTNDSGFPASLTRCQLLYRDLMMATIVVKASFDVRADGVAVPVPSEAQLPISEADVTTDLGTIDGDVVPLKPGCDVAVLGHARSPSEDAPIERMQVDLRIGAFARSVAVFGDRIWQDGSRGGPRPSAPRPFTSIPLTYDRAFGGATKAHEQFEASYAPNPAGRGFLRQLPHVAGTALPNLEELDQLIRSWEETPLPAGLAPLPRGSSLRYEGGGFDVDLANELLQLGPAAFSFAHPRMRMDQYQAGQAVELVGATHGVPWTFRLPSASFTGVLTLGDRRYELPLTVDTLCLFPDHRRIFLVARRACIYQILPHRPRSFVVMAGAPPTAAPSTGTSASVIAGPTATTTIAEQRNASVQQVAILPTMRPEAAPLPFETLLSLYPLTRILEQLPLCPSG